MKCLRRFAPGRNGTGRTTVTADYADHADCACGGRRTGRTTVTADWRRLRRLRLRRRWGLGAQSLRWPSLVGGELGFLPVHRGAVSAPAGGDHWDELRDLPESPSGARPLTNSVGEGPRHGTVGSRQVVCRTPRAPAWRRGCTHWGSGPAALQAALSAGSACCSLASSREAASKVAAESSIRAVARYQRRGEAPGVPAD